MSGPVRWFWLARYTAAAAGIVSAPIAVVGGKWLLVAACAVLSAALLGVVVGRLLAWSGRPPRRGWAVAGGVLVALGSHPLLVLVLMAVLVLTGQIAPSTDDFGLVIAMSYGSLSLITGGAGAWAGSAAWDRLPKLIPAAP